MLNKKINFIAIGIISFVLSAPIINKQTISTDIAVQVTIKQLSKEGKVAYQHLLETDRFEDLYIGLDGHLSPKVQAFRQLLNEDVANEKFQQLLKEATPAGKLYALCGLYLTDPNFFNSIIGQYRDNECMVNTFAYCIISKYKFSNIIESKMKLYYDTPLSKRSLDLWLKCRSLNKSAPQLPRDIVSGYLPRRLRGLN